MALNKVQLTQRIVNELMEEIGLPTIIVCPNKRKKKKRF